MDIDRLRDITNPCEHDYAALLTEYNRVVDYIDSPQLVADLRGVMSEPGHAIGDSRFTANHLAKRLRSGIREQGCPEGWQPLPDDSHDAPPELTNGPLWLATTRGDVRPGYYRQADGNPTVWSSEPTEGVYRWWRPIDADPPSLGAQPPILDYACLPSARDRSMREGIVAHVRDRWVDVHPDGEGDDETIGCRNESGEDLAIGDRVVIQFVPPHTVYVVRKLKGGADV